MNYVKAVFLGGPEHLKICEVDSDARLWTVLSGRDSDGLLCEFIYRRMEWWTSPGLWRIQAFCHEISPNIIREFFARRDLLDVAVESTDPEYRQWQANLKIHYQRAIDLNQSPASRRADEEQVELYQQLMDNRRSRLKESLIASIVLPRWKINKNSDCLSGKTS